MNYDKGLFAFFDSSEATYRRVLRVDEKLGNFLVTKIETDAVELSQGAENFSLQLRQQLRRTADSPWVLTDAPVNAPGASTSAAERPQPNVPSNASETLRRLMEKRRQKTQ